jgi:hypothetical protein
MNGKRLYKPPRLSANMPTFKTNCTRKTGNLVKSKDSNNWLFSSVSKDDKGAREMRHLDEPTEKIVIDNQNILIKCKNGWTKLSLANVKEEETWSGWDSYFKKAKQLKNLLTGHDAKNEHFVTAVDDNTGDMIIVHGNEIISCKDEDLTMAVIQRYTPQTSTFDVTWCLHSENKVINSTFKRADYDCVINYLGDVTECVYDAGPEAYDWKKFMKTQEIQGGDENDWRGAFSPLTDEEEDDDDEEDEDFSPSGDEESEEDEEEEEEVWDEDESETDESDDDSDLPLESDSSSDEDDIEGCLYSDDEGPSLKRRRL